MPVSILLTKGQVAVIDEVDADLTAHKWTASLHPAYGRGGRYMAYRSITVDGRQRMVYLHRAILTRMLGRELKRGEEVDHIDGDTLNNRRSNIRLVTHAENTYNRRGWNKVGFKGVYQNGSGRYSAKIRARGRRFHLGTWETPQEAYAAYCAAARLLHGEYANVEVRA